MGDQLLDKILVRIQEEAAQLPRNIREVALAKIKSSRETIEQQSVLGNDLRDPFLVFPAEVCQR